MRLRISELLPQAIEMLFDAANEQVSVNPPTMMDGGVREDFFQMSQAITTNAPAITAQPNKEVLPLENQRARIMASCLRDFTMMNLPIFIGLKVHEHPQDYLDEVYKILSTMG